MSTGETNLRPRPCSSATWSAWMWRKAFAQSDRRRRAHVRLRQDHAGAGDGSCKLRHSAIVVSGGAMLNGKLQGRDIGSGTDVWRFSENVRAGLMTQQEFSEAESCMSRSAGHCMTMGTARHGLHGRGAWSFSAYNSTIPRSTPPLGARPHVRPRIVEMVREDLKLSKILKKEAFENAICVNGAIGGSTNAVIHLIAIAGRIGVPLTLDDWTAWKQDATLVDLMPPAASS